MRRTETIDVRIPAGVANGAQVRVPGKGNAGTMGAPAGDLYLRVVVRPHRVFRTARKRFVYQGAGDGAGSDAGSEGGSADD